MTVEPVVSSASAVTAEPGTPAFASAAPVASTSACMWSEWRCVAWSGSSRLRSTGYSAIAEPSRPLTLSNRETRTLCVPKSTPATIDIDEYPTLNTIKLAAHARLYGHIASICVEHPVREGEFNVTLE